MRGLLITNMVIALLVLAVSHDQATRNALAFYQSSLITMLHAIAAAAAAFVGVFARRLAVIFLVLSSMLLATLPFSCSISAGGYPGGDDGGAFGWMFYVGCSSLLALLVGVSTLVAGVIVDRREKRKDKHTKE